MYVYFVLTPRNNVIKLFLFHKHYMQYNIVFKYIEQYSNQNDSN